MRLLIDGLIALMLVGLCAGVGLYYYLDQDRTHRSAEVRQALAHLHEVIVTHADIDPEAPEHIYPQQVSPQWFSGAPPRNAVADEDQPWLDVAPPEDMAIHPPDPVIDSPLQAGFWYNPNRGIFRARVPRQFTQQQTLSLYNRLNGCALEVLPEGAGDPARRTTPVTVVSSATAREAAPLDLQAPKARPSLRDGSPGP